MSKSAVDAACPKIIEDENLSWAWVQVINTILERGGNTIAPLVISIHGFDDAGNPQENKAVRADLDKLLAENGQLDIETVAFTIFPERIWKIAGGDRSKLFEYYRRAFPKYRAMNRQLNGKGLYFERLTMSEGACGDGNQLEFIIKSYTERGGVRDSMLQASIFDPKRDHTRSALIGFPCLQHVSFVPTRQGLMMNAFYATQQLFNKAYGNYLGLARLCSFVATECGMPPARLNVFVGVGKLERINKTDPRLMNIVAAADGRMKAAA